MQVAPPSTEPWGNTGLGTRVHAPLPPFSVRGLSWPRAPRARPCFPLQTSMVRRVDLGSSGGGCDQVDDAEVAERPIAPEAVGCDHNESRSSPRLFAEALPF